MVSWFRGIREMSCDLLGRRGRWILWAGGESSCGPLCGKEVTHSHPSLPKLLWIQPLHCVITGRFEKLGIKLVS